MTAAAKTVPGKLGLAIIAVLVLVWFAFEFSWWRRTRQLSFRVCFPSAPALSVGAPVSVDSAKIGMIERFAAHPSDHDCPVEADVVLNSTSKIAVPEDSTISLGRDESMGEAELIIHTEHATAAPIQEGGTLHSQP
jgi:ABC-type transporter Mla subunit MlaD